MNTINRDELKKMIDRGEDFKLVMALDEWAYRAKHIPGSTQIKDPRAARSQLDPNDDIVVYCSGPDCAASQVAVAMLEAGGFLRVRRYVGGLSDWEQAGYPLEGALAS